MIAREFIPSRGWYDFIKIKKGRTESRLYPFKMLWPTLIGGLTVIHGAKCLIVNQLSDGGVVATYWAVGITAYFKGVEACAQGIIHQQPANE